MRTDQRAAGWCGGAQCRGLAQGPATRRGSPAGGGGREASEKRLPRQQAPAEPTRASHPRLLFLEVGPGLVGRAGGQTPQDCWRAQTAASSPWWASSTHSQPPIPASCSSVFFLQQHHQPLARPQDGAIARPPTQQPVEDWLSFIACRREGAPARLVWLCVCVACVNEWACTIGRLTSSALCVTVQNQSRSQPHSPHPCPHLTPFQNLFQVGPRAEMVTWRIAGPRDPPCPGPCSI